MTDYLRLAATLQRLAETQRNLPVPLTDGERDDLREASKVLLAAALGVPLKEPT